MHYAYRLGGPQVGVHRTGDRFHRNKVVLDPYVREAVAQGLYTALPSPLDMNEAGKERVIPDGVCRVKEHSVVVLISG